MSVFKGWQCDNCNRERRQAQSLSAIDPDAAVPPGWIRVAAGGARYDGRHDMCSSACAQDWLAKHLAHDKARDAHSTEWQQRTL